MSALLPLLALTGCGFEPVPTGNFPTPFRAVVCEVRELQVRTLNRVDAVRLVGFVADLTADRWPFERLGPLRRAFPSHAGDGAGAIATGWSREYSTAPAAHLQAGDEAWLCMTTTFAALAAAGEQLRCESPPRPFRADFSGCAKFEDTLELYPGDRVLERWAPPVQ